VLTDHTRHQEHRSDADLRASRGLQESGVSPDYARSRSQSRSPSHTQTRRSMSASRGVSSPNSGRHLHLTLGSSHTSLASTTSLAPQPPSPFTWQRGELEFRQRRVESYKKDETYRGRFVASVGVATRSPIAAPPVVPSSPMRSPRVYSGYSTLGTPDAAEREREREAKERSRSARRGRSPSPVYKAALTPNDHSGHIPQSPQPGRRRRLTYEEEEAHRSSYSAVTPEMRQERRQIAASASRRLSDRSGETAAFRQSKRRTVLRGMSPHRVERLDMTHS
ncbi:hypothetical protein KIPB_010573, partial [Kipferlia bialata]